MNKYDKLNITKEQMNYLKKKLKVRKMEDIEKEVLKELKENFKKLKDPRQKSKTQYKIWDIVCYVILGTLSGAKNWEDIVEFVEVHRNFLRTFLLMTGGIPNWQTIERVMAIIDSKELENIMVEFFKKITINKVTETDIINIDGRVDCGSSRNSTNYREKTSPLNVLNAYSNKYGICLASEMIEEKTNEIPTIPIILERLNIKNTIVTWDALNTQKSNIEAVKNKKGDYVVPVKKNHPSFNADLELYFDPITQEQIIAGRLNSAYLKQEEKSHSSFITYEYFQTSDVKWYHEYKTWKSLNTFGMVKKTIEKDKKVSVEYRYYISFLNTLNISICKNIFLISKLTYHFNLSF